MATSGSVDFALTTSQIIQHAAEQLGLVAPGQNVDSDDYNSLQTCLNLMLKSMQVAHLGRWLETTGYIFLEAATTAYTLGGSSPGHASRNLIETELSVAGSASATTLTVDSTAGMTAADVIGIELDDESIHWTTIVSVNSATGLTITSGLASAAAIDNNVYTYNVLTGRPLKIYSARLHMDDGTEIPLIQVSKDEYLGYINKATTGTPQYYSVDSRYNSSIINIYPAPSTAANYIILNFKRVIEDMDSSTDDPDFPQEWLEPLALVLAHRACNIFGKKDKVGGDAQTNPASIASQAASALQSLKDADHEDAPIWLQPYPYGLYY